MTIIYSIIASVFIVCLAITPIVIKIAKKYNLVDIPKDARRVHNKPMPRVGGIAIVISMFIGLGIYYIITKNIPSIALNEKFLGFLLGGIIIFAMGLIDDIFNLKARYKFLFQLVAALVVYIFGIRISGIKIPFIYTDIINFGWLDLPITLLWIIGITNAINLIDGLDGLSSGIALISCVSMLIIFAINGSPIIAILLITALAGAISGFLPFNFNPAKTFMGDAGSNFLGYCLSVISIFGVAKTYTLVVVVAPLIVLGLPVVDTIVAIFRRIIKGKSIKAIMQADKGHLHHRLLKMGFSQREAVLIMYAITAALGLFAIVLLESGIWKAISFLILVVAIIAIGYKNFEKERS